MILRDRLENWPWYVLNKHTKGFSENGKFEGNELNLSDMQSDHFAQNEDSSKIYQIRWKYDYTKKFSSLYECKFSISLGCWGMYN